MRGRPVTATAETYRLAGIEVTVRTDEPTVLAYLRSFYPVVAGGRDRAWTVDVRRGQPEADMALTAYGVGCRSDVTRRLVTVRAPGVRDLEVTTRKVVRDVLVAHWEQLGYTMLHASAIAGDGRLIVFVGEKRSGKTTLALRAVLEHGYQLVSNDHLVLHSRPPGEVGLVSSSLPTLIPVKVGTYLDLEDLLPAPYDLAGIDLVHWRGLTPARRYGSDQSVYFTYGTLGQVNPVALPVGGPGGLAVIVVFPTFVPAAAPAGPLLPLESAWSELRRHIRSDWVFDRARVLRRLLPGERTEEQFTADGERLCGELASYCPSLRWFHAGDPGPLLAMLANRWEVA